MKNPNNNTLKIRSNNPIIFTVILITLFLLSVSYMAFYNIGLFNHNHNVINIPKTATKETDQKIATNLKITTPNINYPQPVVENYPDSQTAQTITPAPIAPPSITTPSIATPSIATFYTPQKDIEVSFNDYRNYLFNINLLMLNFLQDKIYTQQIEKIVLTDLPQEIKNIIVDLLNYNEHYLLGSQIEQISPTTFRWIEKFIKIEKKPYNQDKKVLKQRIIENLEFFLNFFYSPQFQQKFIEGNA